MSPTNPFRHGHLCTTCQYYVPQFRIIIGDPSATVLPSDRCWLDEAPCPPVACAAWMIRTWWVGGVDSVSAHEKAAALRAKLADE